MLARPDTPPSLLRLRALTVFCLLSLIALGLAWELWLAPLRPGGSWWAIKVLPLCLALPGVLKLRMYTYRWLSLAVWLYFTEACVRGWSDRWPANALAMTQGLLCLALFVACGLHVRLRFRAWRARALSSPEASPASSAAQTAAQTAAPAPAPSPTPEST